MAPVEWRLPFRSGLRWSGRRTVLVTSEHDYFAAADPGG